MKIMLLISFSMRNRYINRFIYFLKLSSMYLKKYLLKNLILNCIRKSTNCMNASMLFVFKKNDSFRFYVDYKELNAFIIKNRCSLSFIDETLDRFVSAVCFIKLDFKNAYHRIKIRKNDG